MIKILSFILLGYIVFKFIKFFKSLFTIKNEDGQQKVYTNGKSKSKIDKNDVIDAQFEEIEIKDKSSQTE